MNKLIVKQIKDLRLGDLVRVEWFDASKGEARVSKDLQSDVQFDIPVTSWGVFLGVVGYKNKHVVLLRDHFEMSKTLGIYDVDFNVVPVGMIANVAVLKRAELERDLAALLQTAFLRARIRKQKGIAPFSFSNLRQERRCCEIVEAAKKVGSASRFFSSPAISNSKPSEVK